MAMFAGQEWFEAFGREIEASEAYREAAADWEGDIAFRVVAEPDRNVPGDLWGYLDLWHGRCRRAAAIEVGEADGAAFTLTAPFSRWKDVVQGELDPIKGMMRGSSACRATSRRSCGT